VKLDRLPPDPGALATFYTDALTSLGAVVERSWYDQIDVLAEGEAARVWNDSGNLHQAELRFPAPDETRLRDASREVFPGCPTTFRLTELLNPQPPILRRAVLEPDRTARQPPSDEVAARTWAQSFPGEPAFTRQSPFLSCFHFSLLAVVRCEIQAIDQVWSAHRIRFSTLDGTRVAQGHHDAVLTLDPAAPAEIPWPELDESRTQKHLVATLTTELEPELTVVRARQQRHLSREIQRIDDYFSTYEKELRGRRIRGGANPEAARKSLEDRVTAAKAEHQRRRSDQLDRHAIRVKPHVDALLLIAERAWSTTAALQVGRDRRTEPVLYVPHARQWHRVQP